MQRTEHGVRDGYVARRLAMRKRKIARPHTVRPATTPSGITYGLRMRNADTPNHGDWAMFVKEHRKAARLSQAELARRLNIDPSTLWRWETGKQKPESGEVVAAAAGIFGADLDAALAAAGLRPIEVGRVEPDPPLDPDIAAMLRILESKDTPEDEKEYIRATMRRLVEMAEARQAQLPKRRVRKVAS